MRLKYLTLGRALMLGAIAFAFIKIYQHNLIIKLNYEYQRLEKRKLQLEKERNDLLAKLLRLQDYDQLMTTAETKWGMKPLKAQQINVLRAAPASVDYLHTASSDAALLAYGLFEVAYGRTGDHYARA